MKRKPSPKNTAPVNAPPPPPAAGAPYAAAGPLPTAARPINTLFNIFIAIALLAGFSLRVCVPGSDSPAWDYIFNTDEGHYSYCTQNKLVHGRFFVNEAKYALAYPVFALAQYLCAAPFSAAWGVARYRFVSIAAGLVLCLLLGLFFPPGRLRWSAIALGALSFMGVIHARYGIPETLLTALMTACVLLAIQGARRQGGAWWFSAGFTAATCFAIKTTGVIMIPVLLAIPLIAALPPGRRMSYYLQVLAGMALGAALLAAIAIRHDPTAWLYFQKNLTSFARENGARTPLDYARNIVQLLLSPALHTMPFLAVAALAWCALVFLPRLVRRQAGAGEAAVFLWLLAGLGILSITSYQPPRWQVIIFPPLTILGLCFFMEVRTRAAAIVVFSLAAVLFLVPIVTGRNPALAYGNLSGFSTPLCRFGLLPAAALFIASGATLLARRLGWRVMLLSSVISLELSWQLLLLCLHVVPALGRPDPWIPFAAQVKTLLPTDQACIAGDMVQDLSLRIPVRTLPTYYLLNDQAVSDASLRAFFTRQSPPPNHCLLIDFNGQQWMEQAPALMRAVDLVSTTAQHIGGLGHRTLYLLRIADPSWFEQR